jgi:hypothetical protein
LRKLIDMPGTLELDPQPVRVRRLPPVLPDFYRHQPLPVPPTEDPQTHAQDDFFRFDCMNIFTNAGVDVPIPDAPRITRNARIRFFMNAQRQSPRAPDPSILLKDAAVMYHGGVHEHDVPAEVPLFEQVVDSAGNVLRTTDGKFAHVAGFNFERQGAGTKCIGCHAGHSMMEVPINGSHAEWFNLAPSAVASVSSSFNPPGRNAFGPERLTDRQARTGGDSVLWIAAEGAGAAARLRWQMPVEVREVVLYGIPQTIRGLSITVDDCRLAFFSGGRQVHTVPATGTIRKSGTRVTFAPAIVDSLEVLVRRTHGGVGRHKVAGLAEIEVIGRLPRPGADQVR